MLCKANTTEAVPDTYTTQNERHILLSCSSGCYLKFGELRFPQ